MRKEQRLVYGPVPSRRLGASLGVDVVPLKVCSFGCTYCQLGPTQRLTTRRRAFYPVRTILSQVARRLQNCTPPDAVTIAGSGEPTLFAGLGELVKGLKDLTHLPVALLTNGSLLSREAVRREARGVDLLLPSLDAGDEQTFQRVNRPAAGLTLAGVVDGLARFRAQFAGQIWLEVMLLAGITDTPESVTLIAGLARRLTPDRVQLNTPVRPTFELDAAPVSPQRLERLARLFEPPAEIIAEGQPQVGRQAARPSESDADVVSLLQRRPCTLDDIAAGLALHPNEIAKALGRLQREGKVHRVILRGRLFWHALGDVPSRPREA